MTMVVREPRGGGDYTPPPAGTHAARCVQLIDLGTQYSTHYKKDAVKILIGWELVDEIRDDGERFLVWRRFTKSLHERSALRQVLEGWRGRQFTKEELDGFDLRKLLGVPCYVSIVHEARDDRVYANVNSVSKPPKGIIVPDCTSDLLLFDLDEPDLAILHTFSDHLQEVIRSSPEWKSLGKSGSLPPDLPDDSGDDDVEPVEEPPF